VSTLTLVAPIKGWVAPLEEVPDPVFAERLLGDGLAIDPTGATVHAPCDGVVASVARHAVTLRAANGAEILIHIGLETVALHGQGFVTHVREGKLVKAGEPLITFDLDFLASKAKSLISPVIVTNGDAFAIVRRNADRETGVGEFLMEIRPLAEQTTGADATVAGEASREVVVPLAHGIHARPAAVLANAAKRLAAEISLAANGRTANAKSIVALMSLGVHQGERVTVTAHGQDAQAAANAIAELIASGLGESLESPAAARPAAPPRVEQTQLPPKTLRGVCGAPGIAIGKAMQYRTAEIAVVEDGNGIAHEAAALSGAIDAVRARVERLSMTGDRARREILGAHIALLDDPELMHAARSAIQDGKSAAFAWRHAVRLYAGTLSKLDDPRLRERVGDLLDLERQVIAAIHGESTAASMSFPPDAILIANELLPSELVGIGAIAGFCTAAGGPTSHVAIIAAGMDLPALVGAGERVLAIADGTEVILDATSGLLHIEPDQNQLAEARARIERHRAKESAALVHAREECRMADGTRIEIFANLGAGADEAKAAVAAGAEGCGLLRTEFLFLDRETPPSEDEQAAIYQAIADALERRPLIIRTFDIGGDKPVPYLPFPPEENPALGLRGVRAGLWRSDLLNAQLGAILRVTPQCRIMLPMVAALEELRAVRAMLDGLSRARGIETRIPLGVMVETPASAVLSEQLAREADFFSIGTNDLTQYTLAMDRGHAQLAPQIDAFHPAVLGLIARAAEGGRAHKRLVAVCGGLAADPLAAAILIGLGIEELSMPPSAIAIVKATIRGLSMETCRVAAQEALKQDSAAAVRAAAAKFLPSN
jgi:phosphocarrier protein FPr/phosphocarrier protein